LQDGKGIGVGRHIGQTLDHPPRHAQGPGGGMVEVEPLETGGQPALDGLGQHTGAILDQRQHQLGPDQQPLGKGDDIVGHRDQPQHAAHAGHGMESGARILGRLTQHGHLGLMRGGDADDALTAQPQRQPQLVTRQRQATHTQGAHGGRWLLALRGASRFNQ
jgi:hypothetical protein